MKNKFQKYIEVATNIGLQLSRDAIWNGDQCNWISKTFDTESEKMEAFFTTLPAEFYSGTVGVSYFLAALYTKTGEPIFLETAKGALNQAIAQRDKIEAQYSISFYRGLCGILYTLTYINQISEKESGKKLYDEKKIIKEICQKNVEDFWPDIIDGSSGAIITLIKVYTTYPSDLLKNYILKLGEQLLKSADNDADGLSWKTRGIHGKNLLGYSHGTAGIAHALLELSVFAKEEKYSIAAYEALKYENKHYDSAAKNWPDFRHTPAEDHDHSSHDHSCAWCHGAPGIGLGRIRAFEITEDARLKEDATIAVETTTNQLQMSKQYAGDFSLCHGLAGNSDLLIEASHSLGKKDLMDLVYQIGEHGIQKHANPNLPWVNGIGETTQIPDFMIGLAGIGYFYLRLLDAERFPSILSINPRKSFTIKLEQQKQLVDAML